MIEFEHDVGIHLDEAAIAVPRKARVAADRREANHGFVVEAKVEDGVHHPRHRHPRAGADRDEQRVRRVAETLVGHTLDMGDAGRDLGLQAVGEAFIIVVIERTDRGRNGEAGRHRKADRRHPIEVRALAAEQILVALAAVGNIPAKAVHITSHSNPFRDLGRAYRRCEQGGRACPPLSGGRNATGV